MKNRILLIMLGISLLTLPGFAAGAENSQEKSEELEKAHEQLREAVAKIRELQGDEPQRLRLKIADRLRGIGNPGPRLGVVITPDEEKHGAKVVAVTPGGPADESGLQVDDVIVAVDGVELGEHEHGETPTAVLVHSIREHEDGDEVLVEYLRNGQRSTAPVVVRKLEELYLPHSREHDFAIAAPYLAGKDFTFPLGWAQLELVSLNPELGEYFGTDEGLLVISGEQLEELGLQAGDVLLDIGGRELKSPSHALRILRSYEPGESLKIRVIRHKAEMTVDAVVPEHDNHYFRMLE